MDEAFRFISSHRTTTTEARIQSVEAAFGIAAEGNNKISHRHSDKFGERIAQVRNPDVAM
jgi:hypothetical protein